MKARTALGQGTPLASRISRVDKAGVYDPLTGAENVHIKAARRISWRSADKSISVTVGIDHKVSNCTPCDITDDCSVTLNVVQHKELKRADLDLP